MGILILIFLIVCAGMVMGFMEGSPATPKCPSCGSSMRALGPISRVGNGGYLGTAGKSHICNGCGRTF